MMYIFLNLSNHMESNVNKRTQPGAGLSLRTVMLRSIRSDTKIYYNMWEKCGMADSHVYGKGSVIL